MNKKLLQKISTELGKAHDKGSLPLYLDGILTVTEIEEIARRIEIVEMLKKGTAQHEIAKKLGVGVATVTRGSKELKAGKFE